MHGLQRNTSVNGLRDITLLSYLSRLLLLCCPVFIRIFNLQLIKPLTIKCVGSPESEKCNNADKVAADSWGC